MPTVFRVTPRFLPWRLSSSQLRMLRIGRPDRSVCRELSLITEPTIRPEEILSLTGLVFGPPRYQILIKRPSGAEPSHDNRLASDSVQGWPEAVLNPRLSHPGYYRANLGALGIC